MPQLVVTRMFVDDLKIHDVEDPAWPLGLKSAVLKRAPRRITSPRTQRSGSVSRTRFLESAILDLAGYVGGVDFVEQAGNYAALERKLLDLDGPHVIRFLRRGMAEEEQIQAELVALDAPAEGYNALLKYTLTMEADDPAVYTAAQRVASYDPTAVIAGGGFDMPIHFPLVFSTTTATHLELVNDGALKAPVVIEIRGPVGNPAVANDTTGLSAQINYQLGDTSVVVIDSDARTVTLNGAPRPDLLTSGSDWLYLLPGSNLFRLTGTGMVGTKTQLTARWREAR